MSTADFKKGCAEIAPLLVFFACGEVNEPERAAIEAHVAVCADCRSQLAEERDFHAAVGSSMQTADELDASGALLAQCRSELAEQLDELAQPQGKEASPTFGRLRWWMALHPAWSGALLILFGLVGGIQFSQWFAGFNNAKALDDVVNVRPGPRFSQDQLDKIVVSGVNLTPASTNGGQNVRVQLSAEQPVVLTGNLDDSDVREVLTYVVRSGERSDSGVRLDCLEALKARSEDQAVRSALLSAARKDPNPAVRLKALDALRNSSSNRQVRETLLQALQHDENPGVRVEAVNILVNSLESERPEALAPLAPIMDSESVSPATAVTAANASLPDPTLESVVRALENLRKTDPSRYVRLRSAAALRQINERNEQ